MDDQAMARLQGEIEYTKRHYQDLRQRLEDHLKHYATAPRVAEHLHAHADEFGFDRTIAELFANPAKFSLVFPTPALAASLRPRASELLDRLIATSENLDGLVAQREDARDIQDPGRARVMVHEGREFTFNAKTGEWRYLDTPDVTYSFPVQRLENLAEPRPEPASQATRRTPSKRRRPSHEP